MERWVGYLRESLAGGRTGIDNVLSTVQVAALTVDLEDRHVRALAMAAQARYLFTHDRGYLRG